MVLQPALDLPTRVRFPSGSLNNETRWWNRRAPTEGWSARRSERRALGRGSPTLPLVTIDCRWAGAEPALMRPACPDRYRDLQLRVGQSSAGPHTPLVDGADCDQQLRIAGVQQFGLRLKPSVGMVMVFGIGASPAPGDRFTVAGQVIPASKPLPHPRTERGTAGCNNPHPSLPAGLPHTPLQDRFPKRPQ